MSKNSFNMKVPHCQRNCQYIMKERYFEPLHVDTSLQYAISRTHVRGVGDPNKQHEPVLLIGKDSDFNQDNGRQYCATYPEKQNDDRYTSTEVCKSINITHEKEVIQENNAVYSREVSGTVFYYYNKTSHKQEDANRSDALRSLDNGGDSSLDAPLSCAMRTSHTSNPHQTLEGDDSCRWKADEHKNTAPTSHTTLRGGHITRYDSYTRNIWTHSSHSGSFNNEFERPSRNYATL